MFIQNNVQIQIRLLETVKEYEADTHPEFTSDEALVLHGNSLSYKLTFDFDDHGKLLKVLPKRSWLKVSWGNQSLSLDQFTGESFPK